MPQWVPWGYCWSDSKGKFDKPPRRLDGSNGSSTDPSARYSFGTVLDAKKRNPDFDGAGIVLTAADDLVAFDLDKCIDDAGKVDDRAQRIIAELDSYTEKSPSGRGIRSFVRGKLPMGARRRGTLEMYDDGRYVTVTGEHLANTPKTVEHRQAQIEAIHTREFAVAERIAPSESRPRAEAPASDDELLDCARTAKNGSLFAALYDRGDIARYDSDHSRADLALCGMLAFWLARDERGMDLAFRRSALMRGKWDEQHGERTYGAMTIATAVASCRETYEPRTPHDAPVIQRSQTPRQTLRTIDASEITARPYKPPRFLVDHLIPERALVLLSGDTGAAKTAFLLHTCVSAIVGCPIAGQFPSQTDLRVLYCNGEMGADVLARYLHEAAAGIGVTIPSQRLFFEGADDIASWRFGEDPTALATLVEHLRPNLVILDTQRALLVDDESDTSEVRRVFGWLRTNIVDALGASIVIAHHLRKISAISNSARERVAGSRDLIASVDVHLAAKARDGAALHALRLDKTRSPHEGVCAGTEWPVEARLEPGAPNRSTFVASAPEDSRPVADTSADDRAADEIRARLEAEGPLTIEDLGATGGAAKRAMRRLKDNDEVTEAGKRGRKTLYALKSALHDAEALL